MPTQQAVCAFWVERTRGRTEELRLGYGVSVWLCEGHASRSVQTQRGGRDLVLTLERLWRSHGCLTAARHKALGAHLAACEGAAARARPGSYSWPRLRAEAEETGIFGVPTFVFDNELFWGGDRIDLLRERLDEKGVARR